LFRFIDWVMVLPEEMEQKLRVELYRYEEEKRMPYISSWERFAMEEGRQQGLEQGEKNVVLRQLKRRIGEIEAETQARVERLSLAQLEALSEALLDFTQAQDLTRWLNRHTRRKRTKKTVN
jgi:predicted transposase YdaD